MLNERSQIQEYTLHGFIYIIEISMASEVRIVVTLGGRVMA